jgi:hypothetical protein
MMVPSGTDVVRASALHAELKRMSMNVPDSRRHEVFFISQILLKSISNMQ